MYLEEIVSLSKLEELMGLSDTYRNAEPFPHIVLENFLEPGVIQRLVSQFPRPNQSEWLHYTAAAEFDKLQGTNELKMPGLIRDVIYAFNSATFLKFLEKLTGIENLISDPHLIGGGMHQILPGGHLDMHVDFNKHRKWQLDRRLNLLLYLNEPWDESWGGALELWDREVKTRVKRIYPFANRVVIFSTTDHSWHGHPDPLNCPPGHTRKSIALYYYTNGRPVQEGTNLHSTIFRNRPGQHAMSWLKSAVIECTPPVILRNALKLRPQPRKSNSNHSGGTHAG